jgi:Zn-dependent protease with chaperone function
MDSRLRDYVFGLGDLNFGWIPLYVVTWGLLAVCGWLRSLALALILLIVTWIMSWNLPIDALALVIGFAPLAISLGTLVLPLGGWLFQQQEGGRTPSGRERAVFEAAFEQLRGADPDLRGPHRWFVSDDPVPNAFAYAHTLLVTRGLLESPSFPAVLAHELGHLNSSDARVSAAIVRMTTPPRNPVGFPFKAIAYLASGRIGMAIVRVPWAMYWRAREDVADAYAAKLDQGPELAAFLDVYALAGDVPTPFKSFGDTSHPWTEHRIDDLDPL